VTLHAPHPSLPSPFAPQSGALANMMAAKTLVPRKFMTDCALADTYIHGNSRLHHSLFLRT
jgi:hypothetical protein